MATSHYVLQFAVRKSFCLYIIDEKDTEKSTQVGGLYSRFFICAEAKDEMK